MSSTSAVPQGYHSLQPYLIVQPAREAIAFYARAFGAKQRMLMEGDGGRVQHAELEVGDSMLMLSEGSAEFDACPPAHYGGSPVSFQLYVGDCDGVYKAALAAGASSLREPADQEYGDRVAGVKDPYGYSWWISTRMTAAQSK